MTVQYTSPRWISVADTAKLVRQSLKETFPTIKFSVRSKSYSMGASIHVEWTDGPTSNQVDRVVKKYEGASFDGMEDLKTYQDSTLHGEKVHYGADYINTDRNVSVNLVTRVAQAYCTWNHDEMPKVLVCGGSAYVECRHYDNDDPGSHIMNLVHDCAEDKLEGLTICIYRGRIAVKRADMEDDVIAMEPTPTAEVAAPVIESSEIVSTPKTPKPFTIKEEAHPFKAHITFFRAYYQDGTPVYIGSTELAETERRLRSHEMVSDITVEYLNPPTPEQPMTTQETPRNDEMFHELYYAPIEEVQAVSEPSQTQETSIHDLITEKQERCEGKPSQDILTLLLKEEQEEGPGNDGLLAAYIKEAYETLEDLVLLINEERLYRRVLSGETVHVQVARTGKAFTIRTTENNTTGLPAYDVLSPSGKTEKRGLILNKSELRTWMYGLVEGD
jgi:Large polyvalent protein associated domain 29